mgnify:FL=1
MSRNAIIFIIILIVFAGAGYFYLTPKIYPTEQISQQGINKQLDESTFKNLETDVITVVFSDSTTGPQAKEILTSHGLNNSGLSNTLENNYTSWLTDAWIHVPDSIETAKAIAEKVKSFKEVYSVEAHQLDTLIQSMQPEREKYYVEIEFIDGIGQNGVKDVLNKINQSRLSTMPSNPVIGEVASRTEIFEPRKDINVTIKNLTSKKAFTTCQQLLSIEKVISCAPLPLLN